MNRLPIHRVSWGTLAILGYILSPLSWWNDLWVNMPIAYAAASLVQAVNTRFFLGTFIATYWASNILGLILMHVGIRGAATDKIPSLSRSGTLWWLAISLVYTAVIAVLVHLDILRPLGAYWPTQP